MHTSPIEWIEIETPEETYHFDVSFMLSTYNCIFGRGCQGGWDAPADHGCCNTSPWLEEDEDAEHLNEMAMRLTPEHFENYDYLHKNGWLVKFAHERRARKRNGYCIFLNTGKTEGTPAGCSLHQESLRRGEDYRDGKPDICWMVPLRTEYNDFGMIITAWDRDGAGGWNADPKKDPSDGWWCMDSQVAYQDTKQRVFETFAPELIRVVGQEAYDKLAAYCRVRVKQEQGPTNQPPAYRSIPVSIKSKPEKEEK